MRVRNPSAISMMPWTKAAKSEKITQMGFVALVFMTVVLSSVGGVIGCGYRGGRRMPVLFIG